MFLVSLGMRPPGGSSGVGMLFFLNKIFRPSGGFPGCSCVNIYCSPGHANGFQKNIYQKIFRFERARSFLVTQLGDISDRIRFTIGNRIVIQLREKWVSHYCDIYCMGSYSKIQCVNMSFFRSSVGSLKMT